MKTSHIFWGTLFIVLGLLILINNFSPLGLFWGNIWQFWPVVLVLIGVSMLIKNIAGKAVIAGAAALVLAIIIFASINFTTCFIDNDFEVVIDEIGNRNFAVTEYRESFDPSTSKAVLRIDGGAGSFKIDSTTENLIYAKTEGIEDNYKFSKSESDSTVDISLKMKKTRFHFGKSSYKNNVEIALNEKPLWDIRVNLGAASIKMDLTQHKVDNIDVDMGAASLDVKLGALAENTRFKIDAGASKIQISVPEEVACEIKTDDVLSSNNYSGFQRVKSGLYRTSNFDEVNKKIIIDIDCGVSSIEVSRY